MKKRKILIPAGIAAGIVIGAVIWQGTRPGEVTNFNKSFEAEQQAPGKRVPNPQAPPPGSRFPDTSPSQFPRAPKMFRWS